MKGHATGDVVKLFIIMINYYHQCAVKGSYSCKDDEREITLYRVQAGGRTTGDHKESQTLYPQKASQKLQFLFFLLFQQASSIME